MESARIMWSSGNIGKGEELFRPHVADELLGNLEQNFPG